MPQPVAVIECASLPGPMLAALADLRDEPGVTVTLQGDRAWIRWDADSSRVLDRVRPIAGVELYTRRAGHWHRLGHRLPAFGVPDDGPAWVPLHRKVVPLPAQPEPALPSPFVPVGLTLLAAEVPHPASALECALDELDRWACLAPTSRLEALQAALSGDRVLVRGLPLPPLAGVRRFWGSAVLIPLGLRPEPDLPESALRAAFCTGEGDSLVLTPAGFEVVPAGAFRPLTRAGIRLALEGRGR